MNRSATYYFLIQATLHTFLGWAIANTNMYMREIYTLCIGGKNLPPLTNLAISIHSWPYVIVCIASVGAISSVVLSRRLPILQHTAFAVQCVSSVLMLISAIGYAIPFTHIFLQQAVREMVGQ